MYMKKYKIVIGWILVVIWASFIFIMSNMDTNKSNRVSKKAVNEVIEISSETTNDRNITDEQTTDSKEQKKKEEKKENKIDTLNIYFRKVAHATEYFILSILLMIALTQSGISGKKVFLYVILICFVYACTDEYHQTFVYGRTGQFTDTLIDTAGGLIACLLVMVKNLLIKIIK